MKFSADPRILRDPVVKPSPIREADHSLSGGLGIMLDDIIAGLFRSCDSVRDPDQFLTPQAVRICESFQWFDGTAQRDT